MLFHLSELSTEPIHRQIIRQVRAKVLTGSLEEGAILPPHRTFARRQRVSAISVERAYQALLGEGLLRRRGEDLVVSPISDEQRRELLQERARETVQEQELSLQELELARDIQCRLLPPPRVEGRGWTVVARNEPARFVAGDFYDVMRHGVDRVDVVVADVSGKGIGPSLIMASVKAVLPFLTVDRSLPEVLDALNKRLYEELGRREFVALAIARLEKATGRLQVVNAGLPDPYRLGAGGLERIEVTGERLPLGVRPHVAYEATETRLDPGERLLLLSDGLPEAETAVGEPLGYDRFAEILAATAAQRPREDPEEWMETLLSALRRETIPLQRDDWTAVLLERTSEESP